SIVRAGTAERFGDPATAGRLVRVRDPGGRGRRHPAASLKARTTAFGAVRRQAETITSRSRSGSTALNWTETQPKRPTYAATENASGKAEMRSACCSVLV